MRTRTVEIESDVEIFDRTVKVVVEVTICGSHRPATRDDPTEYPEAEVTAVHVRSRIGWDRVPELVWPFSEHDLSQICERALERDERDEEYRDE